MPPQSEYDLKMKTESRSFKTNDQTGWGPLSRQVLVAMILWSSFFVMGLSKGTPTVAIPQLRRNHNSTEAVSTDMASWLTSISDYSGAISIFIVIPIAHFKGRKFTMLIVSVSMLISSTIIYFSSTAMHLLISQLILGLTCAANSSIYLLILAEYSSPKYRGVLLTLKSATLFWGIWIANAIGIFTHYKYIGLAGILCSSYCLIVSLFVPESPYWLAFRERYDECAAAHRWLKGVSEHAETELHVLLKPQEQNDKFMASIKSFQKKLNKCIQALKQPDIFKPLLLCCLVNSIYSLSGKLVCAVYSIEMMKKFTDNQSTVYIGVLLLDGFTVFGMYVGCGLSKILKRRTLLLSTLIIGTIFLFALCIYIYLIKYSVLPENHYVIIAMLVGYSLAICSGPMILVTSIAAELLPMRFRSFCVLCYSMFCLIFVSTTLKISPYVFNTFGFQGLFLGCGICLTIIINLVYKYLPETKDKSLYEIADIFKPKQSSEASISLLQKVS